MTTCKNILGLFLTFLADDLLLDMQKKKEENKKEKKNNRKKNNHDPLYFCRQPFFLFSHHTNAASACSGAGKNIEYDVDMR